jgi:hypothetical protein
MVSIAKFLQESVIGYGDAERVMLASDLSSYGACELCQRVDTA